MNAPTEADVLTTLGFQLVARTRMKARPAQRKDLLVAALLVLTAADGYSSPPQNSMRSCGEVTPWESNGSVTAPSTS